MECRLRWRDNDFNTLLQADQGLHASFRGFCPLLDLIASRGPA
jgi:hypothetical protein